MKKAALILAGLVITNICFTQVNYTIPMDSTSAWRIWNAFVYKNGKDGAAQEYVTYQLKVYAEGKTIIDSLVYTRLLKTGYRTSEFMGEITTTYFNGLPYGHVRSDSTCTYWLTNSGEQLLYDFSLQVGDHLPQTLISDSTTFVTSIDTIIVNGKSLRRFFINDTVNSDIVSHWYIEGIGHELGIKASMYSYYYPIAPVMNGFECYAENDVAVFPVGSNCVLSLGIEQIVKPETPLSIYPNPSKGLFTLTYPSNTTKEVEIQIAGAWGEIITSTKWKIQTGQNERTFNLNSLSPGLYVVLIRDGGGVVNRKFVLQP